MKLLGKETVSSHNIILKLIRCAYWNNLDNWGLNTYKYIMHKYYLNNLCKVIKALMIISIILLKRRCKNTNLENYCPISILIYNSIMKMYSRGGNIKKIITWDRKKTYLNNMSRKKYLKMLKSKKKVRCLTGPLDYIMTLSHFKSQLGFDRESSFTMWEGHK